MCRGATRGRRERASEILKTRPDHIDSKRGQGGDPVQIMANYFKLKMKTEWRLYQYR